MLELRKRWDWWGLCDRGLFVAIVVADLGYVGLAGVSAVDVERRRFFDRFAVRPLGIGCRLEDRVGAPLAFDAPGLHLSVVPGAGDVQLRASARTLTQSLVVEATARRAREGLRVTVPFDGRRAHFTCKEPGMAAVGRIAWSGRARALDDGAFAALDYGRGVWPYRSGWHWAVGARDGVAFNLGAGWTDGTGATENGLFVDGELRKIDRELTFADGAIRSIDADDVDLRFVPMLARDVALPTPLVGARLRWRYGRFAGRILDRTVDDVPGWLERFEARW